jgi:hypothetical protein
VPNNMTGFNAYTGLEAGNPQWTEGRQWMLFVILPLLI